MYEQDLPLVFQGRMERAVCLQDMDFSFLG